MAAAAAEQLRVAAEKGDCDKLRELLAGGGASVVNERAVFVDGAGEKSWTTALIQAVGHEQHAAVELLLEVKADPNIPTRLGFTPLMAAAGRDRLRILRTLLDRDTIAIDAVSTEHGGTAFHCACAKGQANCAVELARRGCDMTLRVRGKGGMTGKEMAENLKHTAVLAGLRALVVEKLRAKQALAENTHPMPFIAAVTARDLRGAVEAGDCGRLRELLDGGGASEVDKRTEVTCPETGEKFGSTALIYAVGYDQPATVKLLLEHGANPSLPTSCGVTPLIEAAGRGHLPILQTLLGREGIAINAVRPGGEVTAFHFACAKGHADCAVELARQGCDMTLRTQGGATGKQLAEHGGHTAVLEALQTLVVEQPQEHRAENADNDLRTAQTVHDLRIAAEDGNCAKIFELLQGDGASIVDKPTEDTSDTGEEFRTTALIQAVAYDQLNAVQLLLKQGANPNVPTSQGFTPLMAAASNNCLLPILQLLVEQGAIIDAMHPEDATTAFHCACFNGNADYAVELVRLGCNTKLRSNLNRGATGWDMAKLNGHGVLIRRCKGAEKLALRKAQQQDNRIENPVLASVDAVLQADMNEEQQKKEAKKKEANRKKKARKKKAKKAAELLSQQDLEAQTELAESSVQAHDELAATVDEEGGLPDNQDDGESFTPALLQLENAVVTRHDYPPPDGQVDGALEAAELHLQAEPDAPLLPMIEPQSQPELQSEPEPELDERTQQLQALTELGVQLWSAAQVLEWVALTALPPETVPVVSSAMESLDVDGDDLIGLQPKILQKLLANHGAQNAQALAARVLGQRDAMLPTETADATPVPKQPSSLECPICMELFCDDETTSCIPRILTGCGHTVCHGCITDMLALVTAKNGKKACKCPTCSKVTNVKGGNAANLHKNYALL